MTSMRMLILSWTIQLVISSWEIIYTNFPMQYTGVRDDKKGKQGKKKAKEILA